MTMLSERSGARTNRDPGCTASATAMVCTTTRTVAGTGSFSPRVCFVSARMVASLGALHRPGHDWFGAVTELAVVVAAGAAGVGRYEGEWVDDKAHGKGLSVYASGNRYVARRRTCQPRRRRNTQRKRSGGVC